jgi:hypothetical protein
MSDLISEAPPKLGPDGQPSPSALSRRPTGAWWRRLAEVAGVLVAACLLAAAIVLVPPLMLLIGLLALVLIGAIAIYPAFGIYLLLGATPLLTGIDRGMAIPVLRPSEVLLVLVCVGLLVRGVVRTAGGSFRRPTLDILDRSLLLLAFTSSVVPVLWLLLRGRQLEQDDVLYSLMMWKYYGIYLVAKVSVRTRRQVRRCLFVAMATASIVAIIAIFQSLQLFGVARALQAYYSPYGDTGAVLNNRGGSTLSLPIAVADLMTINLAIAVGFLVRSRRHRGPLLAMGVLFVAGVLASGQFSGAIGLVLGIVVLTVITRRVREVAVFVPVLIAVGFFLLRPVIEQRLEGFSSASGLPESWDGRIYNLTNYFFPKLFSHGNFLLGVQPAARVPTSTMSLGYIWIESGYTWLLWSGGIPLLLAFLWFLWVGLRRHLPLARRPDVAGVAATAVVVTLILVGVLMVIDPHLTYRGSADLLFALLGLVAALRHAEEGNVRRPHPTDVRNLRHRRVVSPSWRPS